MAMNQVIVACRRNWQIMIISYLTFIWICTMLLYLHYKKNLSDWVDSEGTGTKEQLHCLQQQKFALRLAAFFGPWGLDHFYAGNLYLGYAKLFSLGGCGLWTVVDVILWARNGVYKIRGCP